MPHPRTVLSPPSHESLSASSCETPKPGDTRMSRNPSLSYSTDFDPRFHPAAPAHAHSIYGPASYHCDATRHHVCDAPAPLMPASRPAFRHVPCGHSSTMLDFAHHAQARSSQATLLPHDGYRSTSYMEAEALKTALESEAFTLPGMPAADTTEKPLAKEADAARTMKRVTHSARSPELGVVWKDVAVHGSGTGAKYGSDMLSLLLAPLKLRHLGSILKSPTVQVLHPNSGTLHPGETLLVLGRPGSGCSTFLKSLASYRGGYRDVLGQIRYSYFGPKAIQGPFRGEVAYLSEEDVHFPSLTVQQTMDFASFTRAPSERARPSSGLTQNSRSQYVATLRRVLASALGLQHVYHTKVGDAFLRGISGGEKKRVSLFEGMSLTARVLLLDNPTRGLDSSTASEVTRVLKAVACASRASMAAAMYQAGEPLYEQFDKVCLLNNGRVIYFGPTQLAAAYFFDMGYEQLPHQTTADFLVNLTDPSARKIRAGYEGIVPLKAIDMESHWRLSNLGAGNSNEVDTALKVLGPEGSPASTKSARELAQALTYRKARGVAPGSPFSITWLQQLRACIHRRSLIAIGDPMSHIVMMIAMIFQGLIFGSVLYQIPNDTRGFFSRTSALFFMLLFTAFMAQTEIMTSYAQRPIVIRHKKFGMARPSADALANALLDLAFRSPPVTAFVITMYFLCGLDYKASRFFIALGTTFLLTELSVSLNRFWAAMFRHMPNALMVSGLAMIDFALYAGYAIPKPSMVRRWKWLVYWNPMAMAYELLMTNEFRSLKQASCTLMIPTGGSYDTVPLRHRSCATSGVPPGVKTANGSEYLKHMYDFDWAHRWRLGMTLLAIWVGLVLAYAVACEFQTDPNTSTGVLIYARKAERLTSMADMSGDGSPEPIAPPGLRRASLIMAQMNREKRVFTFRDIRYDVPVKGEAPRRLLHNVTGYVAPGLLTAIMGPSGSGKTSLMNVLAQRTKNVGIVGGTITCDGSPLPRSFQQHSGYCEQMDVHLPTSTVREALQFSALLRQSSGSREEKLAWCEEVIEMLDMSLWADALVGTGGDGTGLSVEQRKRVTIGVELAAKPSLLLFLDEPTSGMDALAAWSLVQLLQRLAAAGQSILCTIHQPSGELFAQFDRLILLDEGFVVYNGPIHTPDRSCGAMLHHFESYSGRYCGIDNNPSEFMMDCLGYSGPDRVDWSAVYAQSPMAITLAAEVNMFEARGAGPLTFEPKNEVHEHEYAAAPETQFRVLLWRTWNHYWRSPTYLGSKFFLNLIAGFFIGTSLWGQGHKDTVISLQNRLFSHFIANVLGIPLAQHMLPNYVGMREIFEAREKGAKVYSWYNAVATFLLVEIPWNWVCSLAYWLPWEFMVGNTGSHLKSFIWFVPLYSTFWPALGIWVQNLMSNALSGGVLFSSLYSFCIMFSGVTTPPSLMPAFWRKWMFDTTPLHYYMEAQMGNTLSGRPIICAPDELIPLVPPPGQTCATYLSEFCPSFDVGRQLLAEGNEAPGMGYWIPLPPGRCGWCPYTRADTYLTSIDMSVQKQYRNLWIFALYILFNVLMCFLTFYFMQVFSPRAFLQRWRLSA